jgi:hypothetical protein
VDSGNGFGTRVFWTAVIPDDDVQVNLEEGTAAMHVHDLPVLDYAAHGLAGNVSLGPLWQSAAVPATVSFDVDWGHPVTRRVVVNDAANGFAGLFKENRATVTWSARSSSGFRFTSNPGDFSTSVPEVPGVNGVTAPLNFFAEIGHERNGIFFLQGGRGGEDGDASAAPSESGGAQWLAPPPAIGPGVAAPLSGPFVTGLSGPHAGRHTNAAHSSPGGARTPPGVLDQLFATLGAERTTEVGEV